MLSTEKKAADGLSQRKKTMTGKGSKQRPTNKAKFDDNFDKIFGKGKSDDRLQKDNDGHKGNSKDAKLPRQ